MIRMCIWCNEKFNIKPSSSQKFCSRKCHYEFKRNLNTYICPQCGKKFYRVPHEVTNKNKPYCSLKCWNEYQKENSYRKICIICGELIRTKDNSEYCGKKCQSIGFTLFPPKHRHELYDNCSYCGKRIKITFRKLNKRNFCSRNCADLAHGELMLGEGNSNYINGLGESHHPPEFNYRLKEKIRKRDNRICQICRMTEKENGQKLDVHHIDYDRYNQYDGNLIALCKSCHSRTNGDREFWKSELLKKLEE